MPGLSARSGVVDVDHDVVGDDVLHRLRRLADLAHGAVEGALRKRIDGEASPCRRLRRCRCRFRSHWCRPASWSRSVAIRNSVGVWKLAATVWPIVTLRETTVPSTGEMMSV